MTTTADEFTPPLREDLRLSEAAQNPDGTPAWVIQDAVTNRFFRIGWLEFECLLRWGQSPTSIAQDVAASTALNPSVEQVVALRSFLEQHHLVRPDVAARARLAKTDQSGGWLSLRWWLHHYLFFRIPLLFPHKLLGRLAPKLGFLFSPVTAWLVIGLSVLGMVLVGQRWDEFTHGVVESFSVEGLLSFALAIMFAKTLHELGHALAATRLGLKVGHMGVAFVVLWPMLYTDTGETWKLSNHRQRLAVASAGILTELALAGLATLGWALCEPGALRNGLLYLATTSWLLSILLNASPFMRFDGYFILSDLLDFPNLHERSTALAKTCLRRAVLGLPIPWPESFSPNTRRLLIGFAFVTWIYRFTLFLGIAVAVYFLFFKLLGIALFIVEVTWFIALPVWRELRFWWQSRSHIVATRRWLLWALVGGILLLLVIPFRGQVHGYGLARVQNQFRVFSPFPARIDMVHAAGHVAAGTVLVALSEPDISARAQGNAAGIDGYQARLAGMAADLTPNVDIAATRQRLIAEYQQSQAVRTELKRLTITAPFSGQWSDVNPEWQAGQWVASKEPLGVLVDATQWQVDAYIAQDEIPRLSLGDGAYFYPEGRTDRIKGRVITIGTTRVNELEHPSLSSRFGGPIATATHGNALIPSQPVFHVLVQLDTPPSGTAETKGQVQLEGQQQSLIKKSFDRLTAILLREGGF
jgi:putative peptide zinc metalloprotease protein